MSRSRTGAPREIVPETDLERALLAEPELRRGLAWGAPRWGHPEGRVGAHVADILAAIEPSSPLRAELRLVALLHDSFKHLVRRGPAYSPDADHAVLARRFAERFVDDPRILTTIELHDEPYWIWHNRGGDADALAAVLERVPDKELFLAFVELDASTEGKDPSLLFWLRYHLGVRRLWRVPGEQPKPRAADDPSAPETVYVQTIVTEPESQALVAEALLDVVASDPALERAVEVLAAADGTRVAIVTRWRGDDRSRLLREGAIARRALLEHPELAHGVPQEAHLYRRAQRRADAERGAA